MVIYGNNVHEKLFGFAISKDFLARSTPFCELTEDPDFEVDLDVAINFHAAWNNGDGDAARRAVNTLVLNSPTLDWSTINFYVDKMNSHPFFNGEIKRINTIFNDPNYPNINVVDEKDVEFIDLLKQAASDCLNSPCNIFDQTSDSVARLAQAGSNKSGSNSFDLGSLKGVATNLLNGVDDAVINSIPGAFKNAIASITTTAKNAWSNTQEAFVGKENIDGVLNHLQANAFNARSYRDANGQPLLYTPDVSSYFSLDRVASNILSEVAQNIGGCFDKFQHTLRYNPYKDNASTPQGKVIQNVNGVQYTSDSSGIYQSPPLSPDAADIIYDSTTGLVKKGVAISTETAYISQSVLLENTKIVSFGGYYDTSKKIAILDKESGEGDNSYYGFSLLDLKPGWCPSALNSEGDGNKASKVLKGEEVSFDGTPGAYMINRIASGYTFDGSETNMHSSQGDSVFIEGARFNSDIMYEFTAGATPLSDLEFGGSLKAAAKANQLFAVFKLQGTNTYKIVRVVDDITNSKTIPASLTPLAYKYVFGDLPKKSTYDNLTNSQKFKDAGWTAYWNSPVHTKSCDVRLAIGPIEEIKALLKQPEKEEDWRNYFSLEPQVLHVENGYANGYYPGSNTWRKYKTQLESQAVDRLDPKLVNALINISKDMGRPLVLNSGYRSPLRNSNVGGATNSQHVLGKAADVRMNGINRKAFVASAEKHGINGIGYYSSFIHIDVRSYKATWKG